MAFNIIAESNAKLDYSKIYDAIYAEDLPFNIFPLPKLGINNGDAIGISVPLKYANEDTWGRLRPVLKKLRSKFGCEVYDLYGGQKLGFFNIKSFKKNLFLK
jgi:hypothetical protein